MAIDSVIRLSVSEAARMFGISQRTIRRAIKNQEITYVVVQGRYKINFESVLRWSQRTTTVRDNGRSKINSSPLTQKHFARMIKNNRFHEALHFYNPN